MDKELHKRVIDKQKPIADKNEIVSAKALGVISLRRVLTNRAQQRKLLLATVLKHADALFTQTSKLGLAFCREKINAR
jgi:hypothetical protein